MNNDFNEFLNGYIDALLWSSVVLLDRYVDEIVNADQFELSEEAKVKCESDCRKFFDNNTDALSDVTVRNKSYQYGYSDAGHDFALTRNDHGAGFWEHTGESWDNLFYSSKDFGETDLFVNEDNQLDFA